MLRPLSTQVMIDDHEIQAAKVPLRLVSAIYEALATDYIFSDEFLPSVFPVSGLVFLPVRFSVDAAGGIREAAADPWRPNVQEDHGYLHRSAWETVLWIKPSPGCLNV